MTLQEHELLLKHLVVAERIMSVLIGVSGSSDDSSSSPPPCIFNKDPLAPDIVLRPSDGDNPGTVTKSLNLFHFFENLSVL